MPSKKQLEAQIAALNASIMNTINSIKPNDNIMAEGKYSADILNRFRKGEDIAQFLPGYVADVKRASMRNSEYMRSMKGAGNRALGGVDPNLEAQLDMEFGLKSKEQDAMSYLDVLNEALGDAERGVYAAGEHEAGINATRAGMSISEMSRQRDMAAEEKAKKKGFWEKFAPILGMGAGIAGTLFGGGGLFSAGGLFGKK